MTAEAHHRVLVQCDGATVPHAFDRQTWTAHRTITSAGGKAELDLAIQELQGTVLTGVGGRAADLVRIAAYVYRADLMVSRGGERDVHGAKWRRHLALCIPVADLAYWRQPVVIERLAAPLQVLTGDRWEFAFSQAPPTLRQIPLEVQEEEVLGRPTVVTLISGGTDSLCALLEAAAKGERPVAVGHWSTRPHERRQKALLLAARTKLPWSFPYLGFRIQRQGTDPADNSQRTRGFLYASLGAAVAGEIGVERVSFADNGPVSLNLPINDQLVGTLASRSTHPQFLTRFNQLVADLFPRRVVVANPLANRTRAEALVVVKATHCEKLLGDTLSCSNWRGLPAATPHCGTCSQCVDRRFATIAAELEAFDPVSRYRRDVFVDALPDWKAQTTARSYVRFAQRVHQSPDAALLEDYPQLYDTVVGGDPVPDATVQDAIDLTKRHAQTVLAVLKRQTERHVDPLVEGQLPATCLIRLAPGDGDVTLASEIKPSPPKLTPGPGAVHGGDSNGTNAPIRKNCFVWEGDVWTIAYAGVTTRLRDTLGLARIAYLLARPHHEFTAEDVLIETGAATGVTVDQSELAELELWPEAYAGGGTKFDRKTVVAAEKKVRELLRDIDEARDAGDDELVTRLEQDIAAITREIEKGQGLGGKLRPLVENRARRQDRVRRSIQRGVTKLSTVNQALAHHLGGSLRLSTTFVYAPEPLVTWHITLPKN